MAISRCADHPRYVAGCTGCRRVACEYSRKRQRAMRDGTWERVLAGAELEPPRRALLALLAHPGVTLPRVAEAIGVFNSTLYRLKNGHTRQLHAYVGQALLELAPQRVLAVLPPKVVDSTGAVRRLRALAADGWSAARLSQLSGVDERSLSNWRRGLRPTITPHNHRRICELYDKIRALADPRGDSPQTVALARRHGWVDPDRWDDMQIDDPHAQPLPPPPDTEDHVEVTRLIEGALRDPQPGKAAGYDRPIKREIARQAINRLGWSWEQVAWLMGYRSASTAEYLVHGRPDRPPVRKERQR